MSGQAEPSAHDVERFRALLTRRLGLRLEEGNSGVVAELLRRRSDTGNRSSPTTYLAELEALEGSGKGGALEAELRALARELTVTETYFFRSVEQLRAFREVALPDRMRLQAAQRRVRILSAGCASGEEPYSLAMLTRDAPETLGWEISLRGIDVNVAMLERARAARYSAWALRETSAEIQARCFRGEGRESVLDPGLRALVTFEERNLSEPDPSFWRAGAFDIVFCRNVMMYFTPAVAAAVIARIAGSLTPGGFLFLGYAETLRGVSQDFHLRHSHGAFYYQRREGDERLGRRELEGSFLPALSPAWSAAPSPVIPAVSNDSWVETIRRASERIHALTSGSPAAAAHASLTPRGVAWDVGRAVELIRQERFAEAEATLEALPPESANDADVLLLRAVLLTHGGDLAAAETLCARVLELDEMSAGAHYLSALCREDAGDRRGAVEHDQVAVYLDPAFAMPRLHLGLLARRAGDPETARRELQSALGLLQREEASRLLLFAGGFNRETLMTLCRAELASCGGAA